MTTPFQIPAAYDTIVLDTVPMRGLWKRAGGGERVQKIEQVQAPGYLGAFTIARLEEMVTLDYEVEVITDADYAWLKTTLQVFRQGMKLRPPKGPRVYKIQDLTVEHCEVDKVVCGRLTPIKHLGKGKHSTFITFAEWKKKVPTGGPPAARPKTDVEQEVERMNAENKALEKQLASLRTGK